MALTTTALVLGAGLEKEYGFPDGKELRNVIISEIAQHDRRLKDIFEWSPNDTVDQIVAEYQNTHGNQIRRLTMKILWERENEALLKSDRHHTYRTLIKEILAAKVKGHEVQIVTFNYGRSLPYLVHRVNEIREEELRIETSTIHHIYGRLAPLWFEDTSTNRDRQKIYHEYGGPGKTPEGVERRYHLSHQLDELLRDSKVFFIGEQKAPSTEQISKILQRSDQIFLLGFGYHKPNMDVLGFDFKSRHSKKLIGGTAFGLNPDEIKKLREDYPAFDFLEACDAHTLLSTKLTLGEFEQNFVKHKNSSILGAL